MGGEQGISLGGFETRPYENGGTRNDRNRG